MDIVKKKTNIIKKYKKIYTLICCNMCNKEITNKIIVECKYHYCNECIIKTINKNIFNKCTS